MRTAGTRAAMAAAGALALVALTAVPASAATVSEFPVPTARGGPTEIASGPDGALWFTESNKIGRITTGGTVTETAVPTLDSGTFAIASGPDGALWFTESYVRLIGRITTATTIITEFDSGSLPRGIVSGSDGALWFTGQDANRIGRITTDGTLTEFAVPTANSGPFGIALGSDGALWFTEQNLGKIGRITTAGVVTETAIPTNSSFPVGIASGSDGALWFAENTGNRIGRIATTGAITEFIVPTANSGPVGITPGPDGALWFTENNAGKIGRITTDGAITDFVIPTAGSGPFGIVSGPDGALWFTEQSANKIGRITTDVGPTFGPGAGLQPGGGFNSAGMTTGGRDITAPGVSKYGVTTSPFVVGRRATTTFGSAAARRHKAGTVFRYVLSEPGTVRIVISQGRSGRRRGKRCVAPTRKLRRARKCVRLSVRGTLTRTSHPGANSVAFSGRIGSRPLKPGRYQATLTAVDAAKNTSKPKTIFFTVVKR